MVDRSMLPDTMTSCGSCARNFHARRAAAVVPTEDGGILLLCSRLCVRIWRDGQGAAQQAPSARQRSAPEVGDEEWDGDGDDAWDG